MNHLSDHTHTLKAIEGYLANKADKGDHLAVGLRRMLLKVMSRKSFHVLSVTDQGVNIQTFPTEPARLEFLAKQNADFNDFVCIDQDGMEIENVYTAETGLEAEQTIADLAEDRTCRPGA